MDVGIRYMQEKQKLADSVAPKGQPGGSPKGAETAAAGDGEAKRNPSRPHMRKAHWQTYRTGHGRTGKKILWIPPITVGMPKGKKQEHIPVVVRERKEILN